MTSGGGPPGRRRSRLRRRARRRRPASGLHPSAHGRSAESRRVTRGQHRTGGADLLVATHPDDLALQAAEDSAGGVGVLVLDGAGGPRQTTRRQLALSHLRPSPGQPRRGATRPPRSRSPDRPGSRPGSRPARDLRRLRVLTARPPARRPHRVVVRARPTQRPAYLDRTGERGGEPLHRRGQRPDPGRQRPPRRRPGQAKAPDDLAAESGAVLVRDLLAGHVTHLWVGRSGGGLGGDEAVVGDLELLLERVVPADVEVRALPAHGPDVVEVPGP